MIRVLAEIYADTDLLNRGRKPVVEKLILGEKSFSLERKRKALRQREQAKPISVGEFQQRVLPWPPRR